MLSQQLFKFDLQKPIVDVLRETFPKIENGRHLTFNKQIRFYQDYVNFSMLPYLEIKNKLPDKVYWKMTLFSVW